MSVSCEYCVLSGRGLCECSRLRLGGRRARIWIPKRGKNFTFTYGSNWPGVYLVSYYIVTDCIVLGFNAAKSRSFPNTAICSGG